MSAGIAPGVYVALSDEPAPLDPVRVDTVGLVGVFERGPVDTPVRITSWPQLQAAFGGFIANGLGAYAAKGWLDNGGRAAWVVRVAAPVHETTLTGAQPADRRSSIVAALDGLVIGAVVAVEQAARTWMHLVVAVDPVSARVTWDRPLHPDVDLTAPATVHVATGAGRAGTVLSDLGALPVLELTASSPGAWGNHVSVLATPRYAAATTSVAGPASAAATRVAAVDGFVVGDRVRISQDGGGPLVSTENVIEAIDPARAVLTWASPLAVVNPAKPLRVEALRFTLSVRERGALREIFEGLSLAPGHPRFAPDVLASSALVRGTVLGTGLPDTTGWLALTGGRDGTAALGRADLIGDDVLENGRGLASFVTVDEPGIVAVPDLVGEPVTARIDVPEPVEVDPCLPCPPPAPPPDRLVAEVSESFPGFSRAEIALAQQSIIDHCERRADRIALLDLPTGLDVPALIAWRSRFDSGFAAMYAPWVLVVDPLAAGPRQPIAPSGRLRRVPPCGHAAGLMGRVDAEAGPWLSPANRSLAWVHDVDVSFDDAAHAALNDAGINALRARPARGIVVLGARTVASSDTTWRFLAVRRLFLQIERTLRAGLAWSVFEPASPGLDRTLATAITGLLESMWEDGAFAGDTPEASFFVDVDGGDRAAGEVVVNVGVAAQPPAEVILLQVVRTADRLEIRATPERSV
ncbi:phage tail sheath subtilisin-like domain-containing protein [Solirubrobacter soli]|uniref:phage tail sheath subtilisin-like domain-containing protein n=1 Tax=Solirubrobacter soli TaxID=363832 RepID=UPI0004181E65|nr:phage tail sheath subtilisin-like domain-containing protein [Solirubrobacter soli]